MIATYRDTHVLRELEWYTLMTDIDLYFRREADPEKNRASVDHSEKFINISFYHVWENLGNCEDAVPEYIYKQSALEYD